MNKWQRIADEAERAAANGSGFSSTLTDFSEIKARRIRWLWRDRVPEGKITGLAGRPKIGKGLIYSRVVADVTRGTLDGDLEGPRHVIVVTTEDDPGDTLKPRLMAAGADLSRVSFFQMGTKDDPTPFRVPEHADELGKRIIQRKTALVVIDPLIEFIDGKLDTHKSQAVRQAFASINPLARETGCAILVIIHLNKGASTDAHLRHEASAAFTQVVRGGLLLGHDPDDPDGESGSQRVLAVSSSNLAHIPPALVYRITPAIVDGDEDEEVGTARITCIGESSADSYELLRGHDPDERTERDEAKDYLTAELANGPKSASKLLRGAPCGERTLRKAKSQLGIKAKRTAFGGSGEWVWELPAPKAAPPKAATPTPEDGAALEEPASPSQVRDRSTPKAARSNGVAAFDEDEGPDPLRAGLYDHDGEPL